MLLVDHHEPQPGEGREHRRARTHAHARLARTQPAPLVVALAVGQPGVQHRDRVAEAGDEAGDDLRGQRDFRHHHDRRPAPLQRGRRGAQVDLGLARARDAVEQQPLGPPGGDRRLHRGQRRPLGVGQRRRSRGSGRSDRHVAGTPRLVAPLQRDEAALGQPVRRGVPARKAGRRQRRPGGAQRLERSSLARPEALTVVERGRTRRCDLRRQPRAGAHARPRPGPRREHQAEGAGGRGAVLVGDPMRESHELGGDALLERVQRGGEPLGGDRRLGRQVDHDAQDPPAAEGDDEQGPDLHVPQRGGEQVVEGSAQRARGGQGLHLGDRGHIEASVGPAADAPERVPWPPWTCARESTSSSRATRAGGRSSASISRRSCSP